MLNKNLFLYYGLPYEDGIRPINELKIDEDGTLAINRLGGYDLMNPPFETELFKTESSEEISYLKAHYDNWMTKRGGMFAEKFKNGIEKAKNNELVDYHNTPLVTYAEHWAEFRYAQFQVKKEVARILGLTYKDVDVSETDLMFIDPRFTKTSKRVVEEKGYWNGHWWALVSDQFENLDEVKDAVMKS